MLFRSLSIFMIYLIIGEPVIETWVFSSFLKTKKVVSSRLIMFKRSFIRTWVTAAILVGLLIYFNTSFALLGFVPLHWSNFWSHSVWIKIVAACAVLIYFILFYLSSTILYRLSEKKRMSVVKKLLPFNHVLPQTSQEKKWWFINSLSSAVEEFFYRGFVIFFLMYIFPECNFLFAAVLSVLLDGLRYVGRWQAAIYVFFSSTLFVLLYGLFRSIYIAMILHVIHDLRILLMPIDDIHAAANNKKNGEII